ncbi:hypothetical protein SAMN05216516_102351 [Izhakiella capsodis]|uniref:Uncharacterized protein n=1 Tax=Izhakiella capsodis TaxID=1367852 RepID=A0A1I4W8M8_9GAMM|nr:hypothetical protein SAMN05216516_102351 [Izhakiella capsodis]
MGCLIKGIGQNDYNGKEVGTKNSIRKSCFGSGNNYQDDVTRIGFRSEVRIAQDELRDTSRTENVSLQERRWVMDAYGSRQDAVFRMIWKSFQG